jgi:hypothetical protein
MKTQDVIEQLVGGCEGWDTLDTMAFVLDNPANFPEAKFAIVNFQTGIVQIGTEDGTVTQSFAIKATLEPIE